MTSIPPLEALPAPFSTAIDSRSAPASGNAFAETLQTVIEKTRLFDGNGAFDSLKTFQSALEQGAQFSPGQLVAFQVQASRLHLRTELVARVAEAAHGTVRRLQQA